MAEQQAISSTAVTAVGKPVQVLSWSEKTEDWFKRNVDYFIQRSFFNFSALPNQRKDIRSFYECYNGEFPLAWFSHITNPLSATKEEHKSFPAKIRPTNILRTNIDLLLGEYPKRPFVYNVENLGESGYNEYTAQLEQTIHKNLTEHFVQASLEAAKAMGEQLTPEQEQQLQQEPPLPEQVKADFQLSFKDAIAVKGQKWLKRKIRECEVRRKLHKMFKDWLIAGSAYSYRSVQNDDLIYKRISPLNIDFDKASDNDFVEDGEWVLCRYLPTFSDVVDQFYHKLKKPTEDMQKLENYSWYNTPMGFLDHLHGLYTDTEMRNKVPVYHVQWKGKKKMGFLTYFDEQTFGYETKEVDENYIVDRSSGEQIEWVWVNEVYEGWRIGKEIYCDLGPIPVQRNELNNCSSCKLEYNGRKYSDLHAENTSVLEMGLPFQILYIIVNYILEKTIAKSKGKIIMVDINSIPKEGDWDDEKFFYYSDALGYMLVDRNQIGVDKSFNQFQVLDMTLFDAIKQLIEIKDSIKQEWDEIIGISRQRKGETLSSDGQGVNERAVFQSTVITDMIFIGFEEFAERDLQALLDYAKFLTAKGDNSLYNDDMFGTMLMNILPEDFTNARLGLFIERSADVMEKLREMKSYAQAMLQNSAKPSTVMEVIDAVNVADLKAKLRQIEALEQQIQQQMTETQNEHDAALEQMKKDFDSYHKLLERENMEAEYDRKEDVMYIKIAGEMNAAENIRHDKDPNQELQDTQKILVQKQKVESEIVDRKAKRAQDQQKLDLQKQDLQRQIEADRNAHSIAKKNVAIAKKKASQRPKAATKK